MFHLRTTSYILFRTRQSYRLLSTTPITSSSRDDNRANLTDPYPHISNRTQPIEISDSYQQIPPIVRNNESLTTLRARLVYQSRKRGMLENDLILSTFAHKYLNTFNEEQLHEYDRLLDEPDWDIYYWALGKKKIPDKWAGSEVFELLKEHAKNEARVIRKMPNLVE